MDMFNNSWHNRHSYKVRLSKCSTEEGIMILISSASRLTVARTLINGKRNWMVTWVITFFNDENVTGHIRFSDEELGLAFDLPEFSSYRTKYGEWLTQRYSADVAEQGKFIRQGDCLNIPGPGTGNDGDANISILLDTEIKNAVRRLINSFDLELK